MDLRSRNIQKFARVPLHLNYKLLGAEGPASSWLNKFANSALAYLIFLPVLCCLGLVRPQQQANQLLPLVNYTPHMELVMFAKIGK